MLIGDNYKLESDKLNVILSERKVTNKGKEYWHILGYYYDVKQALYALVVMGVNETGLVELVAINKRIDELYKLINRLDITKIQPQMRRGIREPSKV